VHAFRLVYHQLTPTYSLFAPKQKNASRQSLEWSQLLVGFRMGNLWIGQLWISLEKM
jgi:hypothetical protein